MAGGELAPFTAPQWAEFLALADTFIPALDDEETKEMKEFIQTKRPGDSWALVEPSLKESVSECTEFIQHLSHLFADRMPPKASKDIGMLLSLLAGGLPTLLLTGHWTRFSALPRKRREQILLGWSTSYLAPLRTAFHGLRMVIIHNAMKTSPAILRALQYPLADPERDHPARYAAKVFHEFRFLEFDGKEAACLEADVVVLAAAGLRVVVVEQGRHYAQSELIMSEKEGLEKLFESGGLVGTTDMKGNFMMGRCWGGGSTVNWSASLETPGKVRREWARDHGLAFMETKAYQDASDRVCKRMGVSDKHVRHNVPNQLLLEGARRMGYQARTVPQNTGGHEHYCGYCGLGCRFGEKQGSAVSWLVDAEKNGAQCIQECRVERVLFDDAGNALGVDAIANGHTKLRIDAKIVVVSAGALQTPALLQRSGLKNPNIGKHIKNHTSMMTYAVFDDIETRGWEGGILTSMTTEFDNLDGAGYGPKVHVTLLHPAVGLALLPWDGALAFRQLVARYGNMVVLNAITRDRDSTGTVRDQPGHVLPAVTYALSAYDQAAQVVGAEVSAKMMVAAGADLVIPGFPGAPTYRVDKRTPQGLGGVADPRFHEFVAQIQKTGCGDTSAGAHIMCTARMGADPKTSAVDTRGRVWGTRGCYVADSSLFPTASGANPMITIMSLADMVAGYVLEDMGR